MECIVWTLLFSLFLVLPLHAETRYVWDSCPTPQAPYTVWSNAAVNIQDAVDVSSPGDLIRVTNGTYSSAGAAAPGHTLTNRVCLTNGITVSSVNGPAVTSIQGAGPIGSDDSRRAAYVGTGSVLLGFTLTGGHTKNSSAPEIDQCGGGVLLDGGLMSNCVVQACAADLNGGGAFIRGDGELYNSSFLVNTSAYGAGMYFSSGGYVSKCVVISNAAVWGGGGAFFLDAGTLHDSDVMQNYASGGSGLYFLNGGTADDCRIFNHPANDWGGGVVFENTGGVLTNCFVYGNSSAYGGGIYFYYGGMADNCTVSNNSSSSDGGGAYAESGGEIKNCLVITNYAANAGGGLYLYYGGTVLDSTISENTSFFGGGLCMENTGALLSNSFVIANMGDYGGGLCLLYDAAVQRCHVEDNHASILGGGAYMYQGSEIFELSFSGEPCREYGRRRDLYRGDRPGVQLHHHREYNHQPRGGVYCFEGGLIAGSIVLSNNASFSVSNWHRNDANAVFSYNCSMPLLPGIGNITNDPRFVDAVATNFQLLYGSPCIDSVFGIAAGPDLDGVLCPQDGNYDGTNDYDMGCYEYDPATADSNGDLIPDWWYIQYSMNPLNITMALGNADGDMLDNGDEYVANRDPTDDTSYFYISNVVYGSACNMSVECSASRLYDLEFKDNPYDITWEPVPGQTDIPGDAGGSLTLIDTNNIQGRIYRIGVHLP